MQQVPAKFLQGSILRHVIITSTTNAIGLMAIFMVDLVDIYFISLLENSAYIAAIGYASAILFFSTAISIGLTIANNAIVSQYIAQNQLKKARRYVSHLNIFTLLLTTFIAIFVWIYASLLLTLLGAQGEELSVAIVYLRIIALSIPMLALSMQMSATLRSLGATKHAMYITLLAAIVNALLDPIFIFVLAMDLQGAAISSVCARLLALLLSIYYLSFKYNILIWLKFKYLYKDTKKITSIALPAMLSQLATPLGNLYVTYQIAQFGSSYIAGWAIIGRLVPVVWSVMFAVSGAISPIISQNYGVYNRLRLHAILNEAVKFITGYCLVVSLLLSFGQEMIISIFNAQNDAAAVIRIFCQQISITFIFTGMSFIAMAFMNNLGYAKYATLLNIGKMTLGTIPFVTFGVFYYLAPGILYGQALGNIIFGLIALLLTRHILKSLAPPHTLENNDQSSIS